MWDCTKTSWPSEFDSVKSLGEAGLASSMPVSCAMANAARIATPEAIPIFLRSFNCLVRKYLSVW